MIRTTIALCLLLVGIAASTAVMSAPPLTASDVPLATPPGITLRSVQIGQGVNVPGQSSVTPRLRLIFADAADQPLYTFDKDVSGKSNCLGECTSLWHPALTASGKPPGGWSVVQRTDGSQQWAYRGRPLYTYREDGTAPAAGGMGGAATAKGHDIDGLWHVMEFSPARWLSLPSGMSVEEVPTAPGQVLVNEKKQALYMFTAKAKTRPIGPEWLPVAAPQLAVPFDDFSVVASGNGIYQWAWRGKPLYTYSGDVELGDSNGKDRDARFEVAMLMRYFMPAGVTILGDQRRGGLLATADHGQVLYARDYAYAHLQGGFNTRGANHGALATGRSIGVTGCDAGCEELWRPLKAPDDAQTSGYWSVVARADGGKQWAYQGYALYTYTKDKPKEVTGNAIFDLTVNDSAKARGAPNLGLYWRVTSP